MNNTSPLPSREKLQQALESRHSKVLQEKLSQAKVAVAGLGGLGSNIAVFLARTGIGNLHLIDFDQVDITNLNRQQYSIRQIGMDKTEALLHNLLEINPYLSIQTHQIKVTEENLPSLFAQDSFICEAFDRPEEKAMLVNGILEHFPEKTVIAASGMAGYGKSNAIKTRKISSRFYLCGDETTDSSLGTGLMAPRVALCAAHQANLVIQLILEGHE